MELVTRREKGLFPTPRRDRLDLLVPRLRLMCKHVAAVLTASAPGWMISPSCCSSCGVDHRELITDAPVTAVKRRTRPQHRTPAGKIGPSAPSWKRSSGSSWPVHRQPSPRQTSRFVPPASRRRRRGRHRASGRDQLVLAGKRRTPEKLERQSVLLRPGHVARQRKLQRHGASGRAGATSADQRVGLALFRPWIAWSCIAGRTPSSALARHPRESGGPSPSFPRKRSPSSPRKRGPIRRHPRESGDPFYSANMGPAFAGMTGLTRWCSPATRDVCRRETVAPSVIRLFAMWRRTLYAVMLAVELQSPVSASWPWPCG